MNDSQPGILTSSTRCGRYLTFDVRHETKPSFLLKLLEGLPVDANLVVGLGLSLVRACGGNISALRSFPSYTQGEIDIPSTPMALWCWLRGTDRGELAQMTRQIRDDLRDGFFLRDVVDSFTYREGRDLSGYVDGTENPTGDAAAQAALVCSDNATLQGSSFVAVQQWLHDLDSFEAHPVPHRDNVIGRTLEDDQELEDAPPSAHVKRTAQESFTPEAFVLRQSMPWAEKDRMGLMFVAFGRSFDAFEALLERMIGLEDGIPDALFTFTRPLTGSYYWCPPMREGRLNLDALRT